MLSVGAFEPDKTDYLAAGTRNVINVLPRADGWGPWKDFSAFSQPLADGNDSFTKVLLHADGIDAATTFTDDAAGGTVTHTWTANGSAQIDTAIYKFGGAAGLFPSAGSYIAMPDNADLTIGSNAWTVDLQCAIAGTSGVLYNLAGQAGTSTAVATSAWFIQRDTNNKFSTSISNGTAYTTLVSTNTFVANSTQWHHIEVASTGTTVRLFVDGALEASAAFSGSVPDSANAIAVGRAGELSTNTWLGSIDEFRLSVGVARHTAAFTSPGKAYDYPGVRPSDSVIPGACRGMFYGRKTDGSVVVFAATRDRLFKLNNTDLSWIDVSKGGLAYSPVPNTDHWQFEQFNNRIFAVQANVTPQYIDISGAATAFADLDDLGDTPPNARYIAVVGRFVVLSGLTGIPFRIQWSGLNDPTGWTSGVNSSDFQDFPDGGIVRGCAGGEYGVVFQDTVIRSMIYAVGSAYVFQFVRIAQDKGLLAPYSIVRAGSYVFFLAAQGFHVITGSTAAPVAIGKEKIDRTFFSTYDQSQLQLILGVSDPEKTLAVWTVKEQSAPVGLFNKLYLFDYAPQMQRWSQVNMSGEFLSSLSSPGLTLENLDTISTSLDALTFSLDDVALAALPKIVIAAPTHKVGFFSGNTLEATMDTAEQSVPFGRSRARGMEPITDAPTVYGSIGYRETLDAPRTFTTEYAKNARNNCPANIRSKYMIGRARIPAGTVWTYFSGFEPQYQQESED